MFGVGPVELGLLLLIVLGLALYLARATGKRDRDRPVSVAVAREWQLVRLTRAVGVLVGLLAGAAVYERGGYGIGAMLAPAAFGLCVVLATALGETVVRARPTAGLRTASLTPRRVVDYLPHRSTELVGGMLVLAAATITFTTVTASHDTYTGEVRALTCTGPGIIDSQTPYPGSYYTVPLAAVLVAVLVVAAVAARQVVRRPRGMAGDDESDDALRRRSLDVIVAATGIAVCAPYFGVALTAGGALNSLAGARPSCASSWMAPLGLVLLLSALAAVVVGCVCVIRLLGGGPRVEAVTGSSVRP